MKTVVIVGSLYSYHGPETEVWGVSRAIKHRGTPLTRYYFMDDMRRFRSGEWARKNLLEIGKLKINTLPIVTSIAYPEFVTAEEYDLEGAAKYFGFEYYTCSICYMIADAIRMGYEKIILHQIHQDEWMIDYIVQKAGIDFWCGYALGRGIIVEVSSASSLCAPYFWTVHPYGYVPDDWVEADYVKQDHANKFLIDAVKDIAELMDHDIRPRPTKLVPLSDNRLNRNG